MYNLRRFARNRYSNGKHLLRYIYNHLDCRSPRILILTYHRVLPEPGFDPFNMAVSLKMFKRQIDALTRKYPIVSLTDAVKQFRFGYPKASTQMVLTFDDGYCDNYNNVYPILRQKGLPAAFFIIAGSVSNNRPLWDCELVKIIYNNDFIREIKVGDISIRQRPWQSKLSFIFSAVEKMKFLNDDVRQNILDSLRSKIGPCDDTADRCITWEQAQEMSVNGMEIGLHGLSHTSLTGISFAKAGEEIKKGKEIVESNIKKGCVHFSFPFGSPRDYNQKLIDCVKEGGFASCLLNVQGYNRIKKDIFCFRRIIMDEGTELQYL